MTITPISQGGFTMSDENRKRMEQARKDKVNNDKTRNGDFDELFRKANEKLIEEMSK